MSNAVLRWLERRFAGHVNIGRRLTIYGFNAMHGAVQLSTPLGYVCAKLPAFGRPGHLYVSVNATPWAAWLHIGGDKWARDDKERARVRRRMALAWLKNDSNTEIDALREVLR